MHSLNLDAVYKLSAATHANATLQDEYTCMLPFNLKGICSRSEPKLILKHLFHHFPFLLQLFFFFWMLHIDVAFLKVDQGSILQECNNLVTRILSHD